MKFWSVSVSTVKYVVVPMLFLVPLLLLFAHIKRQQQDREEQEQRRNFTSHQKIYDHTFFSEIACL